MGDKMPERETNISQFAGVNALAKRIEELTKQRDELTKERQDSQTRLLEEHGVALASLEKSVALLVDRTKDLGEMSKRITRLESWKVYLAGIASAFTFIGTLIGGGLTLMFRR
jgi:chromosome segregation ATPase